MRHLLVFIFALVSSWSFAETRPLLGQQPVLSQMTGNCYTHAGTDVLTGIYLKRSGTASVVQPHPLTLGGIVSAHVGRANISSGNTCDFFNEAKKARGEFCSVQAFNRYVATRNGMTTSKLSENVNTLDRALKDLQTLFNKQEWNNRDKYLAEKSANSIIASVCNLNGVLNLDDPKFAQLIDDARDVLEVLGAERNPASSVGDLLRRGAGEFVDLVSSGFGPYLFRRAGTIVSQVGQSIEFNDARKNSINQLLNQSYQNLNSRCVAYARENNLPRVPQNFLGMSARYNCVNETFMSPRLSREQMNPHMAFIERQVLAGYPTSISVCSAAFYGKYPKVSGYRKSNGTCNNGGGHAVTVTDVVTRNGKKMFRIRNSWGTNSCGGVIRGRRECAASGQSGCPSATSLDCEDGVYYMSEDYFSKVLYNYGRLTVSR